MIEDLQDEFERQEQPAKKAKRLKGKGSFLFLAFIVWIIYGAVIVLASLPNMITSVQESDISNVIQNISEIRSSVQNREARICYAIPKADGTASIVAVNQLVPRTGASVYHDVIEALLGETSKEALSVGAINYIASETDLIGISISENLAFVNLSEAFTSSGSNWGPSGLETARLQIEKTLQIADDTIKKVIIMVNGEILAL